MLSPSLIRLSVDVNGHRTECGHGQGGLAIGSHGHGDRPAGRSHGVIAAMTVSAAGGDDNILRGGKKLTYY